jgi:predicted porin
MKKNLLATSALIAAGALASQGALAEAKPISIKVGGYYEQWVGFISQSSDLDDAHKTNASELDVQEDGEIHFKGSTTLDNGLTFGVNVQLEASTSGDHIDENYLFIRGSFGEIVLGSENGPAYAMHYGTDIDKGYGLEEGDTGFYWMSGGTDASLYTSRPAQIDNDGQKIRWFSPRMEGFQIGFSYTPEDRDDTDGRVPNEADNSGVHEQIIAAGVNFDQKFDDVRFRASLVGEYVADHNDKVNGDEDSVWEVAAGLRIGVGGFEGTIAYKHANGDGPASAEQVDVVTAGIAFTDGPLGVSLTGAYGMTDGGDGSAAMDATQLVVQLGVGYKVGPGVSINGTAVYATSEDLISGGGDFTGFGVVGGVKLSF